MMVALRAPFGGSLNPPYARDDTASFKKSRIRMRHLFQMAIVIEKLRRGLYQRIARETLSGEIVALCSGLIAHSEGREALFRNSLSRWVTLPMDEHIRRSFLSRLEETTAFERPPFFFADTADAIGLILRYERAVASYFLFFEKYFSDPWKRMYVQGLIMAERECVSYLECLSTSEGVWRSSRASLSGAFGGDVHRERAKPGSYPKKVKRERTVYSINRGEEP